MKADSGNGHRERRGSLAKPATGGCLGRSHAFIPRQISGFCVFKAESEPEECVDNVRRIDVSNIIRKISQPALSRGIYWKKKKKRGNLHHTFITRISPGMGKLRPSEKQRTNKSINWGVWLEENAKKRQWKVRLSESSLPDLEGEFKFN